MLMKCVVIARVARASATRVPPAPRGRSCSHQVTDAVSTADEAAGLAQHCLFICALGAHGAARLAARSERLED